ncbi:MAG: signal recognition particle-docking protein FtsY [candidate division WOR-3 bacterium]
MLWENLKTRLSRLREIFKRARSGEISEIEQTLILADIGIKFSRKLIEQISTAADPVEKLKGEMIRLLSRPMPTKSFEPPEIILVCGVNGSGKTTTVAKLAHYYSGQQKKVVVACSDTYRDAASLQLEIWSKKAGVDIVTSQKGQDGASVAFDAINHARARNFDCVIVDTAGRLHTRIDLMEELKKIKRVIGKIKEGGPDRILLTIDATLGQNSIKQAQAFHNAIGITGIILTKMDGTAKGGAIIPIVNELNVPVEFLGVGEELDDLVPFRPREFVEALFA